MKSVIFTPNILVNESFYPEPANKNLPEWYKKTESFSDSKKFKAALGEGNQTIKKCMPVFDALSAGYIIKTPIDVYVTILENGVSYYNWPSSNPISFHPIEQASLHPAMNKRPYPKWNNPWSIETPAGYSCLFISPMHNPNGIFTIFPGIVDTDQYINPVNFPFTLDNPNFEGMIPAGTPICQVIPFKRDSFKLKIGNNFEKLNKFNFLFKNKFLNNYKTKYWNRKQYK